MRKKLFSLITILFCIVCLLPVLALAGEVTDQLNLVKEQQKQIQSAKQAWADLEYLHRVLLERNAAIQEIKDAGNFDLLPTKLKVTLNAAWTEYKKCLAALQANPDIVEAFTWRP